MAFIQHEDTYVKITNKNQFLSEFNKFTIHHHQETNLDILSPVTNIAA
jgi:hypothetical protein